MLSRYPGCIHPGEFASENLARKIIPRLNFLPPRQYLKIKSTQVIESLIVPSEFLNFTPMSFDITPVTLLMSWLVGFYLFLLTFYGEL